MKLENIVALLVFLVLLYISFSLITQRGLNIDCKSFGYNKEVSNLDACIDREGKLHFFERSSQRQQFIIPFREVNWTEIK